MDSPEFFVARERMVDGQIRPNKVTDPRVLDAMRELPREQFLPERLHSRAYVDEDVPLGNGRVLMEPMAIARLVQLLSPAQAERGLVVGAGLGYGAALLARCGVSVTALEEDAHLVATATKTLALFAPDVSVVGGPLSAGWPAGAPFDLIFIEGGVTVIPPVLADQLCADSGRLVAVQITPGGGSVAVLAEPTRFGLSIQPKFDCATPLLRALAEKPSFAF